MKLQVEVDIFDDPEFCDNSKKYCIFTGTEGRGFSERWYCEIFRCELTEDFTTLIRKCDQCKSAYQNQR